MKGSHLGEFEELVMLMIGVLHPKAFGLGIKNEIYDQTNRKTSLSAIHAVLQRLLNKGYVKSEFGESVSARGGNRRRYFVMTALGSNILNEMVETRTDLWNKIPKVALQG